MKLKMLPLMPTVFKQHVTEKNITSTYQQQTRNSIVNVPNDLIDAQETMCLNDNKIQIDTLAVAAGLFGFLSG
jgi:hypothetical protein